MADKEEDAGILVVEKTLSGKIIGKLKSRFTWIVVIYCEVLLTQYVLLSYLTPFFPTVADGLGSCSKFSHMHINISHDVKMYLQLSK